MIAIIMFFPVFALLSELKFPEPGRWEHSPQGVLSIRGSLAYSAASRGQCTCCCGSRRIERRRLKEVYPLFNALQWMVCLIGIHFLGVTAP